MIDLHYQLEILPPLIGATLVTLRIAILAFVLAMAIGLVFALLQMSRRAAVRYPVYCLTEALRLTPLLVQVFCAYYVLPEFGVTLPAELTGILAIGLHYATYTSEVYRAGIQAVPKGQWEAAHALGLPRAVTWGRIVLPQAVQPMIPAQGNYLIQLFKEVPLLATITVYELLNTGNLIAGETFRYVEVMTTVALIFFVISVSAATALRWAERRLLRARA